MHHSPLNSAVERHNPKIEVTMVQTDGWAIEAWVFNNANSVGIRFMHLQNVSTDDAQDILHKFEDLFPSAKFSILSH